MTNKRRLKIAAISLAVLLLIAIFAFGFWLANPYQAQAMATNSLISDSVVKVSEEPWLIFEPRGLKATTCLILYPGGRVVAEAFAPAARSLAEQGYLTVIVPMPANLAVLAPDSATEVIAHFNTINRWAIGGHSLGGAMAALYAASNPDKIAGLVLWASYPAQFGWYGSQSGDGQAKISREVQQQIIIEATHHLLQEITSERSLRLPNGLSLARLMPTKAMAANYEEESVDVR